MSFSDLGVPADLVAQLRSRGIESPFPIQQATLPDAIAGRDVCGRAPTGSGKTLAFGLALATRRLSSSPRRPRALVLVPTRELAAQVQREIAALSPDGDRRTIAIYGGTGYTAARKALARGVDTIVACPGRLEDLIGQKDVDLGAVQVVVLDEADRMVDMGFLPAVRRILDRTPEGRQMLLFSATLDKEVEGLVQRYQSNPVRHDVAGDEASLGDVEHLFWHTRREDQLDLTIDLVQKHGRALIFCRTRHGADRLARQLSHAGVPAGAIHGDRSQAQREKALAAFSAGTTSALVATDVAARGIHVDDLPCVVHYDLPADPTDYVHRSGRTGRAGKGGVVVSLVRDEQRDAGRKLQRSLGFEVRSADRRSAPDAAGESRPAAPVRTAAPAQSGSAAPERAKPRRPYGRPRHGQPSAGRSASSDSRPARTEGRPSSSDTRPRQGQPSAGNPTSSTAKPGRWNVKAGSSAGRPGSTSQGFAPRRSKQGRTRTAS